MQQVVVKAKKSEALGREEYRDHYDSIARGVFVPNRTVLDHARRLDQISTSDCPHDFQLAYLKYAKAWSDFGSFVEADTGIKGIAKAIITGGTSVLDAWTEKVPAKVQAIRDAERELALVVDRHANILKPF